MTYSPPPNKGLDSTVGVFGYLCLCLHVLFFKFLLAADPLAFRALSREDYWVENLTAVWFLLAGLLLFITALVERIFFRKCFYIIGGMAMVFVAGEEISWGQRIFGFATPDFLMRLNQQKELTVHNIVNGAFDVIYLNGTLILCIVTNAAFFAGKDRLFGIPLPSILLMLGFLLILSYESGANLQSVVGTNFRDFIVGIRKSFGFIVVEEKVLLLFFLIFTLLSGQVKLVIAPAATLALVFGLSYVNYNYLVVRMLVGRMLEMREYLFGIGCLFYSLEIVLAQGRLAAILRAPFTGLKLPGIRIPFRLMTYSVIAGSIGLVLFAYFNAHAKAAIMEEAYRSITAGEPVVRSNFDVYLIVNELAYVKEPCGVPDMQERFFLHVIPEAVEDLPAHRRQYGFDNLDFYYYDHGSMPAPGGKCIAEHRLPDYPIASIRTGQYTRSKDQIWKAEFPVRGQGSEAAARSAPSRVRGGSAVESLSMEPVERSR